MINSHKMIQRISAATLKIIAQGFPIVVVTGPRQSGKSTLVKTAFPDKPYVTFDDLDKLESAKSDPKRFLSQFTQGAVIDEAQRFPDIFSYLKLIVDASKMMGKFIITGSQQFGLMTHITESLAGRAGFIQLLPFSLPELILADKLPELDNLLFQGMYPPLYDRDVSAKIWFAGYVTTYIERDVRNMLNIRELSTFQRFLRMCASRTGQLLNVSSLANDCGISMQTTRSWLSILEASYIIFLLQPHFANFGKRLVKSPKLYFYDIGLASWLLNIQDVDHLSIHPSRGAIFENLIVTELLKQRLNKGAVSNLYFWRDNIGNEVDIIIDNGNELIPVEIKSGETLTDDYFKTLNKWGKITGKETPSYLIYGGKDQHKRHSINIFPWKSLPEI